MNDTKLYGWRTGALEPPEQLRVEEALRADPLLLSRALSLPELEPEPNTPGLRVPPRGWGLQTRLLQAEVFGGGLRPGDRFRVQLQIDDPQDRAVVVLRWRESWEIVSPTSPEQVLLLSALPIEDGLRTLHLAADSVSGLQIWGVALPEGPELASDPAKFAAALSAGEVPVSRFEVTVR